MGGGHISEGMTELAELQRWLSYDPDTGQFTWLAKATARIKVGSIAGSLRTDGYRSITLLGTHYWEHRLAWFFVYGEWPTMHLDHINGTRDDNRIVNLREVTRSENAQNKRRARRDNSTGVLGVTIDYKKYRAQIRVDGKSTHLGSFDTAEEASDAYLEAKRRMHPANTL